jgi:heme/copper-type cytochrome/quinol oxidase subunit 2
MPVLSRWRSARWLIGSAGFLALANLASDRVVHAQARRDFTVTANHYEFVVVGNDKREIRVNLGDVVRITFDAQDIPHSFTTVETEPHYRIARRAEPGKPVTFEFHADQEGTIPILCTLTLEPRCKEMKAFLIVTAK